MSETRDAKETSAAAGQDVAFLAALVESSDDAIIGKTLDGVITLWNRGAERIYGYSRDEAVGKPISMLIPDVQGGRGAPGSSGSSPTW